MAEWEHGGDEDRGRRRRPAIFLVSVSSLIGLVLFLLRFASFEGLSELLTLLYQASWIALLIHLGCHVHEGYFRGSGVPRAAALELGFVVVWAIAAIALRLPDDPKLPVLAAVWLASAYLLFHISADIEEARERLFDDTDRRLRRASDVIRESRIWIAFTGRVQRVDDPRAHEVVVEVFPETDSPDGNLTRMIWTAVCAMLAIGAIATSAAVAQVLTKPDDPPAHSGVATEGGGGEGGGSATGPGPGTEEPGTDGGDQPGGPSSEGNPCAGERDPSGHMPRPIHLTLSLAWHDVDGLDPGRMEALDYDIGGCPGPARPIPSLSGGWYAPGYCDGDLMMLSIAYEGVDHPVVLLEQAADFTLPMIRKGRFLSAEDRFTVGGEGDAYVIESRDGPYVPIRDTATNGPVEDSDEDDAGSCGSFVDQDVPYTIAGPGLMDLWRSAAAISPGGVYPINVASDDPGSPRITLRSTAIGILTTATCDATLLTCRARLGGQILSGSPGGSITPDEVRALAES